MNFNNQQTQFYSESIKSIRVSRLLTLALALILAVSGIGKLLDSSALLGTLQRLPFVSNPLAIWIATFLPVVELGSATALVIKWNPVLTIALTSLLFAVFLGFSIYGFAKGMAGGCGCFGSLVESGFGWEMVLRNFSLFLAAGFLWAQNTFINKIHSSVE